MKSSVLTAALIAFNISAGPSQADPFADYRKPQAIQHPNDNPFTLARHELGQKLFFDPILSGDNSLSCASCHQPERGFEDGKPLAQGIANQLVKRHTQTLFDLDHAVLLHWDGRAESLEEQALLPIQSPEEMAQDLRELVEELAARPDYQQLFAKAYPDEDLNTEQIAQALATFQRSFRSPTSPFDRWVAGDPQAVSQEVKSGFQLFNGKAKCSLCHSGWRFTDDSFHDIGLASKDPGRFALLPLPVMRHAFKTPSLRMIAERAPYMHDGSLASLDEVIAFYDRGGDADRPSRSPMIEPLQLSKAEKQALIAFLRSLSPIDHHWIETLYPEPKASP